MFGISWDSFPGVRRFGICPDFHLVAMAICFVVSEAGYLYSVISSKEYRENPELKKRELSFFLKATLIHLGGLVLLFLIILYDGYGVRSLEPLAMIYYSIVVYVGGKLLWEHLRGGSDDEQDDSSA